jgi:hypothetical protein
MAVLFTLCQIHEIIVYKVMISLNYSSQKMGKNEASVGTIRYT